MYPKLNRNKQQKQIYLFKDVQNEIGTKISTNIGHFVCCLEKNGLQFLLYTKDPFSSLIACDRTLTLI